MDTETPQRPVELNAPRQELKPQLVTAFSDFMGESILPPSNSVFDEINYAEFKENYPVRFNIWEELRGLRNDYSVETQQRLKRLGKYLHILNSLDRYSEAHKVSKNFGNETLYDEQFDIFEAIRNGLELGETSGYVKLPTGTGKTVLFTEFIEAMGLTTARGEGIKSLIVVPTTIPIGQTAESLEKFASEIPYGKVYGEQKDLREKEKPVTIITDESLTIQIAKGEIDLDSYDLVVFDEAHNYLTQNKKDLITNNFANAIKMGFTATPHYSEEKSVANILPFEYASMPVSEAVKKGMLADVITMYARCGIDIQGVKIEESEYNEEDLEKTVDIKQVNDKFADFYKQNFIDESGIVSCVGVAHATHVAESFREQGIIAEVIHGYMSDKEKEALIRRHGSGEIQVLCFDKILTESYNQPRASVCLNLRPTMSVVMAEQRAGRVLRLDPNNPEKVAKIIDVIYANQGNPNKQVLYPEILGEARVFGKTHIQNGRHANSEPPEIKRAISVDGIDVIIDTEEIMRITALSESKELLPPPSNWLTIGESNIDNDCIAKRIGKTSNWVKRRIASVSRTLIDGGIDQNLISGKFKSQQGHLLYYYSPIVSEGLKKLLNPTELPEGWLLKGDRRDTGNSLATLTGKSSTWINENAKKILAELVEEKKHASENPYINFVMLVQDSGGHDRIAYSPVVCQKLLERATQYSKPPPNWYPVGSLEGNETNIVKMTGRSPQWVKKHLPKILEELAMEQEDLSEDKKHSHSGIYNSPTNVPTIHYSDETINRLITLSKKYQPAPSDWYVIGNSSKKNGTLTQILDRGTKWINTRIPLVLAALSQESGDEELSGIFVTKTGKIAQLCSPKVVEKLKEMAAKEQN